MTCIQAYTRTCYTHITLQHKAFQKGCFLTPAMVVLGCEEVREFSSWSNYLHGSTVELSSPPFHATMVCGCPLLAVIVVRMP